MTNQVLVTLDGDQIEIVLNPPNMKAGVAEEVLKAGLELLHKYTEAKLSQNPPDAGRINAASLN